MKLVGAADGKFPGVGVDCDREIAGAAGGTIWIESSMKCVGAAGEISQGLGSTVIAKLQAPQAEILRQFESNYFFPPGVAHYSRR